MDILPPPTSPADQQHPSQCHQERLLSSHTSLQKSCTYQSQITIWYWWSASGLCCRPNCRAVTDGFTDEKSIWPAREVCCHLRFTIIPNFEAMSRNCLSSNHCLELYCLVAISTHLWSLLLCVLQGFNQLQSTSSYIYQVEWLWLRLKAMDLMQKNDSN